MRTGSLALAFSTVLLASAPSRAQEVKAVDFDINPRDGTLSQAEAEAYLKHRISPVYKELDKDKDGTISSEELQKHVEATSDQAGEEYQEDFPTEERPTEVAKVQRIAGDRKPGTAPFGLRIRRAHDSWSVLKSGTAFAKAKGALVSYSRDLEASTDTWQVRAALLRPFGPKKAKAPVPGEFMLTDWAVTPSLAVDRVETSSASIKDADSLTFKLDGEWEFFGPPKRVPSPFNLRYFRLGAAFATDSNLRSKTLALQADYQPVRTNWGISGPRYFPRFHFGFRLDPLIHAEVGRTFDAGDKVNLDDDDTFFRLGPALELNLWPYTKTALDRALLRVSYRFLGGLTGEPDTTDLFEAALAYHFDELGHWALEINYRLGETPLVADDVDTLAIGLTIKY